MPRQAMDRSIIPKLVVVVVGLFVVVIGVATHQAATQEHRECPHTVTINGVETVSIAGPITNVPEFHDCQRLVVDGAYTPVIAIWVSVRIDSLMADLNGPAIRPIAVDRSGSVTVPSDPNLVVTGGQTDTTAVVRSVPVVQIYSYGPEAATLSDGFRVEPGFSCVYLSRLQDGFAAHLKHYGDEDRCLVELDLTGSTPLPVTPVEFSGFEESDVPPVTRWEIDREGNNLIGVKCGAAWCRIGDQQAGPRTHDAVSAANGNHRVFAIPGWYDEQILAVPGPWRFTLLQEARFGSLRWWFPTFRQQGVVPGNVVGTIFPDPMLGTRSIGEYDTAWVRVAEVHLTGPSARYAKKSNFVYPARRGGPAAVIYLRHLGNHSPDEWNGMDKDHDWGARIVASDNSIKYSDVIWHRWIKLDDTGLPIPPGTVRWRWLEIDESEWEWCPAGCCERQNCLDCPN